MSEIEKAKKILKDAGYILHFWTKEDIVGLAKDRGIELSNSQVDQVAQYLGNIDANIGINWDSIGCYIDMVLEH